MEILYEKYSMPQRASLILGFFDGIHAGHIDVVRNCPNTKKILVTFSTSPAEFFRTQFDYIYPRMYNYRLLENLGIEYIFEQNFSNLAKISAKDYLTNLIREFNPVSITTGFNHTFGAGRQGNPDFLKENQGQYEYYCTPPTKIDNEIVSSTKIKELLKMGNIEKANKFLTRDFSIESTVIEGVKLGRQLGFPTANMKYPQHIVKIPYGVYKVKVGSMSAIMNWGVKPTIGAEEILEVHIPNYNSNLYGQSLRVEIVSKIRDEKKFENLEDLKKQIEKDVEECLK